MVKIGVLGAGGMGNVHTRHYKAMPDVEVSIFDIREDAKADFAGRHQVKPASSLQELIDWADAIDVCLPTDLHKPHALMAIAAGKSVLCEKPMGIDEPECIEMIEAASKAGVLLMPAQVVRCFPEFKHAHDLVVAGKVGTPIAARTRRGGKAPVGSGSWFTDTNRSGGVLLDLAIHDFDWLRWTFGEVASVSSRTVRITRPEMLAGLPGDYSLTTLEFDSGLIAHVEGTWLDPSGFRATFEICGTDGMIEFDSRKIGVSRVHTEGKSITENPMDQARDPYYVQGRGFVEAIVNKTAPPVTALDGLMAVSIARAAMQSAATGKPVSPSRHF